MNRVYNTIFKVTFSLALCVATTQTPAAEEENGFSKMIGSVNSSIKSGFSKVSQSISPKPIKSKPKVSDATSIWSKSKPSAHLYVTAAQTHVSHGNLQDAEDMYKRALKISPKYAEALIGYAQLKDRQGAYGEAVAIYEKAARANPEDASVFNGMGLCHATHGNFEQALSALEQAVKLQPGELRYRNNIAMVLVEMGRYQNAFAHFKTQFSDAEAHYNLAYLIQKRGDKSAALDHFAAALDNNPNFAEARVWFEHLSSSQTPVAQTPVAQTPVTQTPIPHRRAPQQYTQQVVQNPAPVARQPRYPGSIEPSISRPRVWTPRQQTVLPQQPMTAQRTQLPPQHAPIAQHQSAAQREAMAKQQLDALGSATTPVRTPVKPSRAQAAMPFDNGSVVSAPRAVAFRPRPGHQTALVARQHSIQRLPPIEQALGNVPQPSAQVPSGQAHVHQLTAPPVPLPPKPTAELTLRTPAMSPQEQARAPQPSEPPAPTPQVPVRSAPQFEQFPRQNAAPLPGPVVPTAPPTSGTTRAPVVYPLPPVDGYQY